MQKLLFFSILFLLYNSSMFGHTTAHDVPMAIFKFQAEEDYVSFKIKFIREDIEAALLQEYPDVEVSDTDAKKIALKNYIKSKLRLRVDLVFTNLIVADIKQDEHFILLTGRLGNVPKAYHKIEVWNTCLLGVRDGHSNIVHLAFHGKERSFRMSEKRQKIIAEYKKEVSTQ